MGKNTFIFILAFSIGILAFSSNKVNAQQPFFKMLDATNNRIAYAIAPSIVKKDGVYHAFSCTTGSGQYNWDFIRYQRSTDGSTWSTPVVKVRSGGNPSDMSACDPSVVFYQGYYYIFYGSAYKSDQTVIQVARSAAIDGSYLTYTERGTWENRPQDAKKIIEPFVERPRSRFYGAGQPSVIVKDGKLKMWYTDDTVEESNGNGIGRTYALESTNPVLWTPDRSKVTNRWSDEIKYDPITNRYVMISIENQHQATSYVAIQYSADGSNWTNFETLIDSNTFPNFANNPGMSSDESGNIISNEPVLFGFAAPYDLSSQDYWGFWDLYGTMVTLSPVQTTATPTPTITPIRPPSATPTQVPSSCSKKAQGDADCNNIINEQDYFYYVQQVNGSRVPPGVNSDFNGDYEIGKKDRDIIIRSLQR